MHGNHPAPGHARRPLLPAFLAALLALAAACAKTVAIDSLPQGAELTFDGQVIGPTPNYVHYKRGPFAKPHIVELRLEGHEPFKIVVSQSWDWKFFAPVGAGAVLGAILFFPLILVAPVTFPWAFGLEETYRFTLVPEPGAPEPPRIPTSPE